MKQPYHLHVVNDEINLITLAVVAFAVLFLFWLGMRLWQLICAEREQIKAELPALIVGEMMTRSEFVHLHERVFETEAKLEYVENRLDAHLVEVQQIVGNG